MDIQHFISTMAQHATNIVSVLTVKYHTMLAMKTYYTCFTVKKRQSYKTI